MVSSLRDIPGAQGPRRRQAPRGLRKPARRPSLDFTPGPLPTHRPRRRRVYRSRRPIDLFLWTLALVAVAMAAWIGHAFWSSTRIEIAVAGVDNGQALTPGNAAALNVTLAFASPDELFRSTLTLDGVDVKQDLAPGDYASTTVLISPQQLVTSEVVEHALDEGDHEIKVSVGRFLLGDSHFTWRYSVDSIAPVIDLPSSLKPVAIDKKVTVQGSVEKGASLTFAGNPLATNDGRFKVTFDSPPTGVLRFEATDEAGNQTLATTVVPVTYPEASRGIHVSAAAWADDELRTGVLNLIDEGRIDTVELDLKDESGMIGYQSKIPEALRIGSIAGIYDLAEVVRTLDAKGVRVVGRLVAFRDPIYAEAAWSENRQDEVLQTPEGGMLSAYGGFTNYANAKVRDYNLDIALEAVSLGVKDILWDYIRRPEGAPDTMVVPDLVGTSSDSVAGFLSTSHEALRRQGAYQGASVFGIAAAAGDSIAQDVPKMATAVDYLAPMLYPSHWGAGMYRVANPIKQPGEIIAASLADFQRVTKGTGVRLLPWLQDFTLYGVPYNEAEVRAQIASAAAVGVDGFLLWNPRVRYTAEALDPIAP